MAICQKIVTAFTVSTLALQMPTYSTLAQGLSTPSDVEAIQAGNEVMNRAYATKDTALFGTLLMNDFQMITGAANRTGRIENMIGMARLLQKRPDLTMVFKPNTIDVGTSTGAEGGTWVEYWTEPDGRTELRGSYLIMWVKQSQSWRQKALLLAPTRCIGGAYCR